MYIAYIYICFIGLSYFKTIERKRKCCILFLGAVTVCNVAFECRHIFHRVIALETKQWLLQHVLQLVFARYLMSGGKTTFNPRNHTRNIDEKRWLGKRVPVLFVFQSLRIKIIGNYMKMQWIKRRKSMKS